MAAAGSIRAGKAFVELSLKDSLAGGLNKASAKLKAFGASITSLGAQVFGIGLLVKGALEGMAVVFANMGSDMLDLSQRTGISVEALSTLGFAAEQAGSNMEELERSLKFMQKSIDDDDKAFQRLGLSIDDLKAMSPDKQFEEIGEALSRVEDPAIRTSLAMGIFGKSATRMLPLFSRGTEGLKALTEQAKKLGIVMSTEDAKAAEAFGDKLSAMWKVLKMSVFTIGSALAPALDNLAQIFTNTVALVNDWIKNNKELVILLSTLATVVMGAGVALIALGVTLKVVGLGLSALAGLIGILTSPITLVVGAIAGLTAAFFTMTEAGGEVLDWLGQKFGWLKDFAIAAWEGIRDAIAAGDLALAFKVVTTAMQVLWRQAVAALDGTWQNFKQKFLNTGVVIAFSFLKFVNDAWANVQIAWLETTNFIAGVWDNLMAGLKQGWNQFAGFFGKVWAKIKDMFGFGDAEEEIAKINEEVAASNDAIEEANRKRITDRRAEADKKKEAIREEQAFAEQGLNEEGRRELQAIEKRKQEALSADKTEIDAARKAFNDAVQEAKRKREEADQRAIPGPGKRPDAGAIDAAKEKISTAGTFSGALAGQLATSPAWERTAKATEKTAQGVGKLVDLNKNRDFVFV